MPAYDQSSEVRCVEEKEHNQRKYALIKKASKIEKYYLIKWLKNCLIEDELYKQRSTFRCLCDTISLFNLNMNIEKYCNKTKSDFMDSDFFSWSNLNTDWLDELEKVHIEIKFDLLYKKLNWLKDLYFISDVGIEFLIYIYFRMSGNLLLMNLYKSVPFSETDMKFWKSFIPGDNGDRNYILLRELFEKGIIFYSDKENGVNFLTSNVFESLKNTEITTKHQFISYLVGKEEKSNLALKDFSYIKYEKVSNILKQASKQGTQGINILLYGAVGTGKTEFSKVASKEAGLKLYSVKTELQNYKEAKREDRLADLCSKQILLEKMKNVSILFDEAEDVLNRGFSENGTSSKGYMNRLLENTRVPVIWTTNNVHDVDPAF